MEVDKIYKDTSDGTQTSHKIVCFKFHFSYRLSWVGIPCESDYISQIEKPQHAQH